MAEPHVISALVKKRAELLGDIEHYENIIKESKQNLISIDKTILIFDDSYNIKSIKAKKTYRNRYFENGEAKVYVLDILREIGKPLKTDELSEIIAKKKNLEFDNTSEFKSFQKSVSTALKNACDNNLVEKIGTDKITGIWKIKDLSSKSFR